MAENILQSVVYTRRAQCRDCYRCLRGCPVKAIRMHHGQAEVVGPRCLSCGTCIRDCPQQAKVHDSQVATVKDLLARQRPVHVSLAPSFAGKYPGYKAGRIGSALRRLGFAGVWETAQAASHVAQATADYVRNHPHRSLITTACPASVAYIERYAPDLVGALTPIASPMIAHGRMIRRRLADAAVVFIGPCVAKKAEALRPENRGLIDAVLTFQELDEWLEREGIDLSRLEESTLDSVGTSLSRIFPLEGGQLRCAGLLESLEETQVLSAGGFEECLDALEWLRRAEKPVVLEPLFCRQGCLNGPAMGPADASALHCRREVLLFARSAEAPRPETREGADTAGQYRQDPFEISMPEEDAILQELQRTGKEEPADRLDCGACGYSTCRDKAIAVLQGMAERQMCLPYMRKLAEQRTDRIIETSPNGIVILDEHLRILNMNPAFRKMFVCSEAMLGKRISTLMDPTGFERLATGRTQRSEGLVRHEKYSLLCHQILYVLPEEKQLVGIFVNVTQNRRDKDQLDKLRTQTMNQARELLEHQVSTARQMARLLGEGTAKGEGLLEKLMEFTGDAEAGGDFLPEQSKQPSPPASRKRDWKWTTST